MAHSKTCWIDNKDEIQITMQQQGDDELIVYTFHQEEKTKLSDLITVFTNPDGYITQVIIKKQSNEDA